MIGLACGPTLPRRRPSLSCRGRSGSARARRSTRRGWRGWEATRGLPRVGRLATSAEWSSPWGASLAIYQRSTISTTNTCPLRGWARRRRMERGSDTGRGGGSMGGTTALCQDARRIGARTSGGCGATFGADIQMIWLNAPGWGARPDVRPAGCRPFVAANRGAGHAVTGWR